MWRKSVPIQRLQCATQINYKKCHTYNYAFPKFSSKRKRKHQRKWWGFFSSNSNMEFLPTWKNFNFHAFIRWAGVNPDSYLKKSKKRIETKKRAQKVDTVCLKKIFIMEKWLLVSGQIWNSKISAILPNEIWFFKEFQFWPKISLKLVIFPLWKNCEI